MSWHFSQALVEEFSGANSSAGELFAPWKSTPSAADDSCSAKMKATCHRSPYGMMFVLLTDARGEELLTWFRVDSLAKMLPPQARALVWTENEAAYGRIFPESYKNAKPRSYGLKIAHCLPNEGYPEFCGILPKWGMMQNGACYQANPAELGIRENAFGFSLPTLGANEYKGSSKVRFRGSPQYRGAKMSEGLRISETDPIYTDPNFAEAAMGWPITWTASTLLETDKFRSWLQQHGISCQSESPEDYLTDL